MLKWILGIAGGLLWCLLVFLGVWWFTFPSDAVVDRVAFEVQKSSGGKYALKAVSASPWWTGLSLSGVTVSAIDDEGVATPMLLADSVSARSSLFSLITGGLPVHAVVDLKGNPVVIDAELDRSQNPPRLTGLDAEARDLDVGVIMTMLRPLGAEASGDGDIEVLVDAKLGEDVDDHDGRMKVKGKDLTLNITLPDPLSGGDFIIEDMKVSELDLVLDIKDGEAQLKRGRISSDRADIDIDIDADLAKNFNRTRLNGTMVLSNLGGELKTFEAAFAGAKWTDGKYHYRISCRIGQFSTNCIKPDRQPRGGRAVVTPDPDAIRERMERSQNRTPASADERKERTNPDRRRPSRVSATGDDGDRDRDERDDEEPLDDEEELEEDEEPIEDDRDDRRPDVIDVAPVSPADFDIVPPPNPALLPR